MNLEYSRLVALGRVLRAHGFHRVNTSEWRRYEKVVVAPCTFGRARRLVVMLNRESGDGSRYNTVAHEVRPVTEYVQLTNSQRFETGIEMLAALAHEISRDDHMPPLHVDAIGGWKRGRYRSKAGERDRYGTAGTNEDWRGRPPK